MKNIIYKISCLLTLLLVVGIVKAQLPLVYGDAVITHSPTKQISSSSAANLGIVVRVIKTANTTTAPFGNSSNWNTNSMLPIGTPSGTKAPNYTDPNWNESKIGNVFGITLDDNFKPNIYVSSTQIYNAGTSYSRIVWRLDGTSGAPTKVFDFGVGNASLGNLKYARIGSTENIYVSDWQTGNIMRLTGTSTGSASWVNASQHTPAFPGGIVLPKNVKNAVYGLAIRKSGAAYRLYYARISDNSNSNSIGGYGSNEIYSIALDVTGNFTGTEQKETINITLNKPSAHWGGYPAGAVGCVILPVIADLAFTSDGTKMLIGQQSWQAFGTMAPHNSGVYEVKINTAGSWDDSFNYFPSGSPISGLNCSSTLPQQTNCTGGISYSNNILVKDSLSFKCDTTIWFSSDYIGPFYNNYIYGIQGMRSGGGTILNSVKIDADDDLNYYDKNNLGDVEVYKKPLECSSCTCGKWESGPTLNGALIPGVTNNSKNANLSKQSQIVPPLNAGSPIDLSLSYPIQFVQGNVTGVINAVYQCTGNCGATYSWDISGSSGVSVASGTSLPIDLSKYNSLLKCGNYNLIIKSKCGNSNCESLALPITIICEPPSCCKAEINIELVKNDVTAVTNIPNPNAYSTDNLSFNLNFSVSMSEVRVNVEEFRLVANSPNCLNCNNRPVTWGNILSASLNGTGMVLSGMVGPPTGSLPADYREAVYNTGGLLLPPSAVLNISLSLPAVTDLKCCEVSVYACLKFTFKDAQCRECVKMVCGKVKLIPKNISGLPDEKDANNNIDAKSFNVDH